MKGLLNLVQVVPDNPLLLQAAVCLFLFAGAFAVAFGLILGFCSLRPAERIRSQERARRKEGRQRTLSSFAF